MGKDLHQTISDREVISKLYSNYTSKYQIIQLKMGYRSKQRILNRGISNGQKTLKEMFNIVRCQGNANQMDSEILSYTCQND